MAQLIEADLSLPSQIYLSTGDVLMVKAAGGRLLTGYNVVEILGPFITASMLASGEPLAPMGNPNTVLFVARESGSATVDVVTGDSWAAPQSTQIEIIVGQ